MLYQAMPLRAEELSYDERRSWLVDVFDPSEDPVLEIAEKIAWSERAALLGVAGGAGVGKTTQAYRLIDHLWMHHQTITIRVGYEDYSSLSSPPDITDFLLSVAGGLATEAQRLGHLPPDWNQESINSRLIALLKRLRLETEISAGPLKVGAALREDESFRRRIRDHLSGQVSQLVGEVRVFVAQLVAKILEAHPGSRRVAMIVDSTERLSAPASADEAMRAAVRNLFLQNSENLRFDDLHVIYFLPPWLPISDGGALRFDIVGFPMIRVANRDDSDSNSGMQLLDTIVKRRMPNIEELISASDLKELCRMSGGVQRVLFQLLQEVADKARGATSLPIESTIVSKAVNSIRQDYLAITSEAAPALRSIDASKSVDGLDEASLAQLGRYFQALVVLQVANGDKWVYNSPANA